MKRPKTGGRRKGTPNKATVRKQELIKALCPDGKDPMTFFTQLMQNPDAPLDIRAMAAKELAPYVHPKLASIEARTGGKTHEDRLKELHDLAKDDE